ncbi:rRNA-processing endoribonuclease [Geranomyces michiganensis]|nr:rRNA-processing endoribonuclease [Geranomyces michiganensis]
MPAASSAAVSFWGTKGISRRLVLSLLTRTNIVISGIRVADEDVHIGINEDERCLIELFRQLCPAARISVIKGGAGISVQWHGTDNTVPGGSISHACSRGRSIAWFAEFVLLAGSVAVTPLSVHFTGPASDLAGNSIDALKAVSVPLLKEFGVFAFVDIVQRTAIEASVGGSVIVRVVPPNRLTAANLTTHGPISRVRGVAYSAGLDSTFVTLAAEAAENLVRRTVPDTEIEVVVSHEESSDKGYGLTLVASAAPHTNISASCAFCPRGDDNYGFPLPDNLGVRASRLLLQQLTTHGCVDAATTPLVLMLLALAQKPGSAREGSVRLGSLDAVALQTLRDINACFGLRFDVTKDVKNKTFLVTPA